VVRLTRREYTDLLTFRAGLRRFLRWSEAQAIEVGLTPAQHQLLLAVKGHPDRRGPTIREVSAYLSTAHHSAGELVERAEAGGYVRRCPDSDDARLVRVRLTALGDQRIRRLAKLHLQELHRLAPLFDRLGADHDVEPSAGPAGG